MDFEKIYTEICDYPAMNPHFVFYLGATSYPADLALSLGLIDESQYDDFLQYVRDKND